MLVKSILGFVLMTLFVSPSFAADTIQDENNETLMSKGMWKDPKTNLIWMRCSYGESFVNGTCSGSPTKLTWGDAATLIEKKYEGLTGWRLPTMEELHGIIDCGSGLFSGFQDKQKFYDNKGSVRYFDTLCRKKPKSNFNNLTIDNKIFPENKANRVQYEDEMYWTIYSSIRDSNAYGYVDFSLGTFDYSDKYKHFAVRLVKGGNMIAYFRALPHVQRTLFEEKDSIMQKSEADAALAQKKREFADAESLRLLNGKNGDPAKYSTSKGNPQCKFFDGFIINGDGTATDPRNNLTWKRCPEGSHWEGSYCSSGTESMDWVHAMGAAKNSNFLNKNDWRLPTIDELRSIAGSYSNGCTDNRKIQDATAVSPVLASPLDVFGSVGGYWSTTKSEVNLLEVLGLHFLTGFEFSSSDEAEVRLVRSDSIASKQEFDSGYSDLKNAQFKIKMAEFGNGFGNGLTLENFFTSSEYLTVLKNFTPTVEALKNDETFGIKVIYPKKTFEFTKTASCKSKGTSTKEGRVGYFEEWLGSVKSRTLTYDNLICHGNNQEFAKFEQKLTGKSSIASRAFDSTWSVEKLTKNEVERYDSSTPSSLHKYTSYKVVSMYDDKAYVRCLPDSSYTKEEVLWRRDSGKYAATGWFDSLPFDKAARLVCNIDD